MSTDRRDVATAHFTKKEEPTPRDGRKSQVGRRSLTGPPTLPGACLEHGLGTHSLGLKRNSLSSEPHTQKPSPVVTWCVSIRPKFNHFPICSAVAATPSFSLVSRFQATSQAIPFMFGHHCWVNVLMSRPYLRPRGPPHRPICQVQSTHLPLLRVHF